MFGGSIEPGALPPASMMLPNNVYGLPPHAKAASKKG